MYFRQNYKVEVYEVAVRPEPRYQENEDCKVAAVSAKRNGSISVTQCVFTFIQISSASDYLHF